MAIFLRVKRDRMAFVNWLGVDHWFSGGAVIIHTRLVVAPREFRLVPVLAEIEVQPGFTMKPLRRSGAASWMEGNQVNTFIPLPQAASHCSQNFFLAIVLDGS